ncbi:MAG: hypothetical protein ACRDL6_10720 [Solirubrobacterales bacterium]
MKRLFSAAVVCALAVGLTAAPSGVAKKGPKGPKQVSGTVSAFVVPNPAPAGSLVTASGNVKASSNCRKDRDVLLTQWVNTVTGAPSPTGVVSTVETGPNGDYSTMVMAPTAAGTYVLQAFVDDEFRKVGSKKKGKKNKKGRQFNCMEVAGQSPIVTVP